MKNKHKISTGLRIQLEFSVTLLSLQPYGSRGFEIATRSVATRPFCFVSVSAPVDRLKRKHSKARVDKF